ncbi:sensor histidine kinase [Winogradskyella vidalii]|uniref:sensor histidine kinase n=1 Tax=Winogradskyella vidalii TaxID=2615024 RepID=UPI0015CDBD1E|nr:HAMP domain-containing sensor histidine kinase [Winogradskyella vidalii]
MSAAETALKERIKELTCLYEVSSIIGNTDADLLEDTLKAITLSLNKAFKNPQKTTVSITTENVSVFSNNRTIDSSFSIQSDIKTFNDHRGQLTAYLEVSDETHNTFLPEEQLLLNNIALKIGSLLEHIEIKKNETSLRRQMQHVGRLEILGEITAGIAHEINTPLANILGFAELIKSDLKANKQSLEDVDKIIQNAIFSREVVKKLMFFSCEMPQEMKQINCVPTIKNAIKLLDATFRKEQVKYKVNIHDDEIWLRADPIQLQQIIFNLLINAIYFSPKNGLVTIEAKTTKKEIILKISDEGKGFSTDDLSKIFQPFFTTKPIGEGSGLGLSVVHGIVASHKGSIVAKNNKNKGAIFTITLPKD